MYILRANYQWQTSFSREVDSAGDGFFLTFETPSGAVDFALRLQEVHANGADLPSVRIGVHLGEVTERRAPADSSNRPDEALAERWAQPDLREDLHATDLVLHVVQELLDARVEATVLAERHSRGGEAHGERRQGCGDQRSVVHAVLPTGPRGVDRPVPKPPVPNLE